MTAKNAIVCPFPDEAMRTVVSYLRRSGQTVVYTEGSLVIAKGAPNITIIEQAYADGALSFAEEGSIQVCGARIMVDLNTLKLRRSVEDHLRKSASKRTSSVLQHV